MTLHDDLRRSEHRGGLLPWVGGVLALVALLAIGGYALKTQAQTQRLQAHVEALQKERGILRKQLEDLQQENQVLRERLQRLSEERPAVQKKPAAAGKKKKSRRAAKKKRSARPGR